MALLGWVLGIAAVYGALFATGAFIYGRPLAGAFGSLVATLATCSDCSSPAGGSGGRRRPGARRKLSSCGSYELETF